MATVLAAMILGCGGAPPTASPVSLRPPPLPAAAAVPVDPDALMNLDFEQLDGEHIHGWGMISSNGEPVAADRQAHGGEASLRLDTRDGYVAAQSAIAATPYRGKRVELRGWIRTAGVPPTGGAALWLGTTGPDGALRANTPPSAIHLDQWTETVAAIEVPADAGLVVVGVIVGGRGTAWFDDLHFAVADDAPPASVAIGGIVRDPDGAPASGASVALVDLDGEVVASTTGGADGRFRFTTAPGTWMVTALHASGVGARSPRRLVDADNDDLEIALVRDGGVIVNGDLGGPHAPSGMVITVAPATTENLGGFVRPLPGDGFAVPVAPDGTFTAVLPRSVAYSAMLDRYTVRSTAYLAQGEPVTVHLDGLAPAPSAVAAWLRKHAIAIATTDLRAPGRDLAPLRKAIGKAHVVGLGQAVTGARELTQLQHRLIAELVSELGFTVLAIDADPASVHALEAYLADGTGDARTALRTLGLWNWNTEEALAMVEWLRAWNAARSPPTHVHAFGYGVPTDTTIRNPSLRPQAQQRAMAGLISAAVNATPGVRVVVVGDARTVSRKVPFYPSVGSILADDAAGYHAIGLGTSKGSFLTSVEHSGRSLTTATLAPPPPWDVSLPFAARGPIVGLDLRAVRGAARPWFEDTRMMRFIGATFTDERGTLLPVNLVERYDSVIFVETITPLRPLP